MPHRADRPPLAPLDPLGREIQRALDLVKPVLEEDPEPKYDGYCGAASEAYLHLARERGEADGLRVQSRKSDGVSHWWLLEGSGRVIDLTLGPADRRWLKKHPRRMYAYEKGRGSSFRQWPRPSRRAAAIIRLVEAGG